MENIVWYSYKFSSLSDIMSSTKSIFEYSPLEYAGLFWIMLVVWIAVYYIIPFVIIVQINALKEREKRNKKNLLNKIRLQKQIEDEIDEELKNDEKRQIEERKKALEL